MSVPGDPELRTAKVPGNLSTFMSCSPDDTPGPPNLYILQVPTSFGVTRMRLSYQSTALRDYSLPHISGAPSGRQSAEGLSCGGRLPPLLPHAPAAGGLCWRALKSTWYVVWYI